MFDATTLVGLVIGPAAWAGVCMALTVGVSGRRYWLTWLGYAVLLLLLALLAVAEGGPLGPSPAHVAGTLALVWVLPAASVCWMGCTRYFQRRRVVLVGVALSCYTLVLAAGLAIALCAGWLAPLQ